MIQETINPVGETSTRAYDAANRLIQAIDPLNRATNFGYDDLDRITQVQDAVAGSRATRLTDSIQMFRLAFIH